MKIGVWILPEYNPNTGGGFSLYDKIIQLIDEYNFSTEIEVCFVGEKTNSHYQFKKEYICISSWPSYLKKPLSRYSHKVNFLNQSICHSLRKNNIDLIYYPVQGFRKVNNFPFAVANWDIGHKTSYAFPEAAMNGTFEYREKWYSRDIFKALMIFAESTAGKEELVNYTGLNPDRIGIVPLFSGGVVDMIVTDNIQSKSLQQLGLTTNKYFFYPAQFWAHKNHYNLLLAFKELNKEFPEYKLVFTGSDKGNKKYIEEFTVKSGLSSNVVFTGFINNETLYTLYKNATAMVMPSFLGPTNMPLIEASELNCPVLCSNIKGHREIMQDGAYYFDPLDHQAILTYMKKIIKKENREELLQKANAVLKNSIFNSRSTIKSMELNFIKLKSIRSTWGQNDQIF